MTVLTGEITDIEPDGPFFVVSATVDGEVPGDGTVFIRLTGMEPTAPGGRARTTLGSQPVDAGDLPTELRFRYKPPAGVVYEDLALMWVGRRAPAGGAILNHEQEVHQP